MLYVLSAGEIMLMFFVLLLFIKVNDIINRHYYTKHIKKLEKAVKELKTYGFTNIDID